MITSFSRELKNEVIISVIIFTSTPAFMLGQGHYKSVNLHVHTADKHFVSCPSPAVFGSCSCVALSLDYVVKLLPLFV